MSRSRRPAIEYDPSNVYLASGGLSCETLAAHADRLDAARQATLADVGLWKAGTAPPSRLPMHPGFIDWPQRLLADYKQNGEASELGQILETARVVGEAVDRIVLVGIGGSQMGTRAIFEACCHPFHNELSRGRRAGWPRLYFDGHHLDNDERQALFDLLESGGSTALEDRWGVIVVSKGGNTLETSVALRQYLARLRVACGGDTAELARRVIPITGHQGKLAELASALGCPRVFRIPTEIGGRFSVLTAVGLLPAALLGLDVLRLLEGAAAMTEHFRHQPVGQNVVLDYVGICHAMEVERHATIRVLAAWDDSLEMLGYWYDQLLSESLGKSERGATPITTINPRDLHSRGQQHQEGTRDKLITNVIVPAVKRDRLPVGTSPWSADGLDSLADKTLPDLLAAAAHGVKQAYRNDNRPTADLIFPARDEYTLGQFFQMMMLATVVEGRLVGINPYGQPGVEAYREHMHRQLSGKG